MDRVLLIVDDIQYCRHVEMTLRKAGFDVESVNNEFNLNETLLTFNPDFIICKGNSSRLSALNVGKKLRESSTRSPAKVILILPEGLNVSSDELIKLKMDLLLFEPIGTLKLSMSLFSLAGGDVEFAKDKLLKFAITDTQFRNFEQQLLRVAGVTLDSEIESISEMRQFSLPPPPAEDRGRGNLVHIKGTAGPSGAVYVRGGPDGAPEPAPEGPEAAAEPPLKAPERVALEPAEASADQLRAAAQPTPAVNKPAVTAASVAEEVEQLAPELPLRIDSYNHAINKVDQNLNVGLKKRQTKAAGNQLHKDLMAESKADKIPVEELDAERIRFTKALFRK